VFLDESGFSLRPNVRRTWAPKGCTPILVGKASWKKLSGIGAIACNAQGRKTQLYLELVEGAVNSETIIAYLEALQQQLRGPVVLLWDGLSAHKSARTKAYLEENRSWLEAVRFPSYAPELNPVEYLWSYLKGTELANYCPDALPELREHVEDAVEDVRCDHDLLVSFLHASELF
jgi:transposase